MTLLPKVNQILHIQIESIDEEEARQEYKSRIADVTDTQIVMEVPINEKTGRLKKLYQGDSVSAFFLSEGGVKNYFSSVVTGFRDDVIRLVMIRRPEAEAITQVQRRSFLRVPAELEIALRLPDGERHVAVTDDLSGGGLSLLCPLSVRVSEGQSVECWLLIHMKSGAIEYVPFTGEIVRAKPHESGKQQIMLQFADISDKDRQKVIRYCFERQLDIRKR
ncbi:MULTISPECIES: flagellar brake protein [Paenibacillus]|uniref:flagellar brake protein n=1 Tax=Paenibacillus TaxID=44249 RepID=UPI0022B92360|nr:flagellar brake domain-containing protein [Paenibacillus caseinilyticus]MCZ8520562.1 PilZ domain-containing protein [Paenibacillus caseinilyticus]